MATAELSRAEYQNEYHKARRSQRREIGLPDPYTAEELALRARCRDSLKFHLQICYPEAFYLPFSHEQDEEIATTQRIIVEGGLSARAAPRGDGKTTRAARAALWAILEAYREFVTIVGATEKLGEKLLKLIKFEMENNPLLWRLYRRELWGIAQLRNDAKRCIGQLAGGEPTRITWAVDQVVMPTVPGSLCSGSILTVSGITGAIRGQIHEKPGGRVVRPSLVLLDDPQTRESAKSPMQSKDRAATINGDVLGLAGPGVAIAAVMLCTVIQRGDLSDTFLDQSKHPEWQGHRSPMVYVFPKNEALWEEYREKRADSYATRKNCSLATEFYQANREAMDEGTEVSWPERFDTGEASALQHAMNLKFRNESAFWGEYQNAPQDEPSGDLVILSADEIIKKLSGFAQGVVPVNSDVLTAHIDIHDEVLYYAVGAFAPGFSGQIIDRGTFPPQPTSYFTLRKAPRRLSHLYTGVALEAAIVKGLGELIDQIVGREWKRENGTVARLRFVIIDCGYKPEQVELACRISKYAPILMPSRGIGVGATDMPFAERDKYKKAAARGDNWYISASNASGVARIWFDSNYWKTFLHGRLCTPLGASGCLSLFNAKPAALECFAEHLTAEFPREVLAQGRRVVQWELRTGRDNHWLDNTIGCHVAASRLGMALEGQARVPVTRAQSRPRNRVSYIQ
jgi:hypothetical protein